MYLIHLSCDHVLHLLQFAVNMRCVLVSTGLLAVLCLILWLLWQGEENWKCRVPIAPCLLPGWDGCLRLQFHHSVKKVIITLHMIHIVVTIIK